MSCWDKKSQFYHHTLKNHVETLSLFLFTHSTTGCLYVKSWYYFSYLQRESSHQKGFFLLLNQPATSVHSKYKLWGPPGNCHSTSPPIQSRHTNVSFVTNDFLSNPNSRSCPNFSLLFTEHIQFPTHSRFWKVSMILNTQKVETQR